MLPFPILKGYDLFITGKHTICFGENINGCLNALSLHLKDIPLFLNLEETNSNQQKKTLHKKI